MRDAAIDPNRQPRRPGAGRAAAERPRGDLSSAAIAAQRLGGTIERTPGRAREASRRAKPEPRWGLPSFVKRVRPVKALTTVAFSAALVGIVANAVLFQKGHHTGVPSDVPHGAAAVAPVPADRVAATSDPGPTGAVTASPDPVSASAPAATPPAADAAPAIPHRPSAARHAIAKPGTTKPAVGKPAGGDAIGQLIGASPAAGSPAAPKASDGSAAEAKADPALLRAQRQLKKLGYAVKPDGRMDGGTRQAIRRFAHDHHLKAEAALTPELRRQIADASSAPAKPAAEPAAKAQ